MPATRIVATVLQCFRMNLSQSESTSSPAVSVTRLVSFHAATRAHDPFCAYNRLSRRSGLYLKSANGPKTRTRNTATILLRPQDRPLFRTAEPVTVGLLPGPSAMRDCWSTITLEGTRWRQWHRKRDVDLALSSHEEDCQTNSHASSDDGTDYDGRPWERCSC